jgi:hypothetical protein
MSDDSEMNQTAALAEFAAMRAEIVARQGFQHTLMALNLTISGTVFGFAFTQSGRLLILLVLPYTTFMTCGRYISHDYGIEQIGQYIREGLSPRVRGGLGWEEHIKLHRVSPGRRLFFGLDPLFIGFPGVALAALAFGAYPLVKSLRNFSVQDGLLSSAWLAGLLLVGLSFRNIWKRQRHFILSDWRRRKSTPVSGP